MSNPETPSNALGNQPEQYISNEAARIASRSLDVLLDFTDSEVEKLFPLFKVLTSVQNFETLLKDLRQNNYPRLGPRLQERLIIALDGLSDMAEGEVPYILSCLNKVNMVDGTHSLMTLIDDLRVFSKKRQKSS
jgi:hypothetical protein